MTEQEEQGTTSSSLLLLLIFFSSSVLHWSVSLLLYGSFWFGFVFQSTCKSIETKSGIYKCCGFYENIIKHISNKAHQSILLFCYFSPLTIQVAIFITTTATVVLAEFYFKTSGCEDEMSSNICIRIAWKFYCYFQEIILKKNYCKWKFQNFNHYHEQKIQSGWGDSLELIKMYDILHFTSVLSFILFCFLFVVLYIYIVIIMVL